MISSVMKSDVQFCIALTNVSGSLPIGRDQFALLQVCYRYPALEISALKCIIWWRVVNIMILPITTTHNKTGRAADLALVAMNTYLNDIVHVAA